MRAKKKDGALYEIVLKVNGEEKKAAVTAGETLLHALREKLGQTEVKEGCGKGDCGTCAVLLNGEAVNSCLTLALQADGQEVVLVSDGAWKASEIPAANWEQPDFNDQPWRPAAVAGAYGAAPWGRVSAPAVAQRPGGALGKVRAMIGQVLEQARRAGPPPAQVVESAPSADFRWPEAIVFVGDDCSLYRPQGGTGTAFDSLSVTQFTVRKSRA